MIFSLPSQWTGVTIAKIYFQHQCKKNRLTHKYHTRLLKMFMIKPSFGNECEIFCQRANNSKCSQENNKIKNTLLPTPSNESVHFEFQIVTRKCFNHQHIQVQSCNKMKNNSNFGIKYSFSFVRRQKLFANISNLYGMWGMNPHPETLTMVFYYHSPPFCIS